MNDPTQASRRNIVPGILGTNLSAIVPLGICIGGVCPIIGHAEDPDGAAEVLDHVVADDSDGHPLEIGEEIGFY